MSARLVWAEGERDSQGIGWGMKRRAHGGWLRQIKGEWVGYIVSVCMCVRIYVCACIRLSLFSFGGWGYMLGRGKHVFSVNKRLCEG